MWVAESKVAKQELR